MYIYSVTILDRCRYHKTSLFTSLNDVETYVKNEFKDQTKSEMEYSLNKEKLEKLLKKVEEIKILPEHEDMMSYDYFCANDFFNLNSDILPFIFIEKHEI